MNILNKISTKLNTSSVEKEHSSNKAVKAYYAGLGVLAATAVATAPTMAISAIFSKISDSLKEVYDEVFGISSVLGITLIAVCLIIRMASKNQRSVEEATSWIKRIIITWLILNLLGMFLTYAQDLVNGGSVNGSDAAGWN